MRPVALIAVVLCCYMAVAVLALPPNQIDSAARGNFVDSANLLWWSDRYTWGSFQTSRKTGTIIGAALGREDMYLTEDYGQYFGYNLTVSKAGAYLVELHFAELYWDRAGARRFDVIINGQTRTASLDIFAMTKKAFVPHVIGYQVYTSTRSIIVTLRAIDNNAQICGLTLNFGDISLVPPPAPSPPPRPPPPPGGLTNLPYSSGFSIDYNYPCAQPYNGNLGVTLTLSQGTCGEGTRIRSRNRYQYGIFEATLKTTDRTSSGIWMAFYLSTNPWFARNGYLDEIDFEFRRTGTLSTLQSNWWSLNRGHHEKFFTKLNFTASAAFHKYRINWNADFIEWSLDGVSVQRTNRNLSDPFFYPLKPMYVLASIWRSDTLLPPPADVSQGPFVLTFQKFDISAPDTLPSD